MSIKNILELEAEHYVNRVYGEDSDSTEKIKLAYIAGAKRKDFRPSKAGTISSAILAAFFLFFSVFGTITIYPIDAVLKVILVGFFIVGVIFSIMSVSEYFKYKRDKYLY